MLFGCHYRIYPLRTAIWYVYMAERGSVEDTMELGYGPKTNGVSDVYQAHVFFVLGPGKVSITFVRKNKPYNVSFLLMTLEKQDSS